MHKSLRIYLTIEENLGKAQVGDRSMKVIRPVIALNGVSYFQMRSLGSHSMSRREKEGTKEEKKKRKEKVDYCILFLPKKEKKRTLC